MSENTLDTSNFIGSVQGPKIQQASENLSNQLLIKWLLKDYFSLIDQLFRASLCRKTTLPDQISLWITRFMQDKTEPSDIDGSITRNIYIVKLIECLKSNSSLNLFQKPPPSLNAEISKWPYSMNFFETPNWFQHLELKTNEIGKCCYFYSAKKFLNYGKGICTCISIFYDK